MTFDPDALDDAAPALFQANPLPMLVYDRETLRILAVNDAALSTYGYTREQLLEMSMLDIRPPEDRAAFEAWVREQEAAPQFEPTWRTRRHRRKDGTTLDVEIALSIAMTYRGRSARLMIAIDVTERNRDLERLRAYGKMLEEAQDLAGLAMLQFDLRARRFRFAGISREVFGRDEMSYDEALAMLPTMYHPDDLPGARGFFAKLGTEYDGMERDFRLLVRGEMRWFHGRVRLVRAADGTPASVIAIGYDVTESKNEDARLRTIAFTDSETGLRNRASLFEDGAPPVGDAQAVLMVHLAPVAAGAQRSYQHRARNAVAAAKRLRRFVPAGGVLARYSDYTYAIVLGAAGRSEAPVLAEIIVAAFEKPLAVSADEDLIVVPTVGFAECPRAGLAELVRRAESALSEARRGGRTACYTVAVEQAQTRRALIDQQLPRAVERERLRIAYQPIVEARSGRVAAAEALMRWGCDELGEVPASEFVAAAEESGAIVRLGEWILREACAQLGRWDAAGAGIPRIAVNVSAREVRQTHFVEMVERACADGRIAPSRLELELTERATLDRDDFALRNIDRLRRLGVRIAIDDFGTGYSALAYVASLPLDTVKIDRSLIAPIPGEEFHTALAASIVELAHRRGLSVVAEGVEEPSQLAALRAVGCDEVQGFLLGRPVAAAELQRLVAAAPA